MIEKIDVERLGLVEVKSVLFDKVEIAVDQYYAIEQVATKLNEIIEKINEQNHKRDLGGTDGGAV